MASSNSGLTIYFAEADAEVVDRDGRFICFVEVDVD